MVDSVHGPVPVSPAARQDVWQAPYRTPPKIRTMTMTLSRVLPSLHVSLAAAGRVRHPWAGPRQRQEVPGRNAARIAASIAPGVPSSSIRQTPVPSRCSSRMKAHLAASEGASSK